MLQWTSMEKSLSLPTEVLRDKLELIMLLKNICEESDQSADLWTRPVEIASKID
jgi:hypothetical protein